MKFGGAELVCVTKPSRQVKDVCCSRDILVSQCDTRERKQNRQEKHCHITTTVVVAIIMYCK